MRVKLEENYKDFYTVTEYEQAKAVIEAEKEDEESAKGWAEYAVHEALKGTKDYLIERKIKMMQDIDKTIEDGQAACLDDSAIIEELLEKYTPLELCALGYKEFIKDYMSDSE